MSWYNKVVWSEGLFLRPQLFQQQERYLEYFAHKRSAVLSPFFWGFSHYEIDRESLAFGKLVFKSGAGIFPDGTPFDVPGHTPPPQPLTIAPEHQNQVIYVAVPLRLPNTEETTFAERNGSLARYLSFDDELRDSNAIGQGPKPVQLANLRLRLLPEKELTQSWIGVALTRVKSLHADGAVSLHTDDHIPPVTGYGANPLLRDWTLQLHGLARLRADALAARLSGSDGRVGAAAEVADYLLLQVLNRYEPLLDHLCQIGETAPVDLYREFAMLAGELSTFVRPQTRRPIAAPGYDHARLYDSIKPLVDEIHYLLNQVLIRGAQPIPLTEQAHGIRTASMLPAELAAYSSLVLAVGAQMSPEVLQQQFAAQTKISQPQRLPELIRSHLPGLTMVPLPVPPRQIPFNSGFIYFELSRSGPFWEQIARQGGLAMHIAGHFPELKLELWGVRQK
ncbi:type VI secretion system baseplate subunit TssK [Paraburkholderia caballeronis]|uniref:Type VI secretion system protein ImpJ n=1 Tax=Paraburkholderia caballeronis TaxID=416943 RepID=A0A1H7FKX8_9BURK|nr:type VI secretion system baseplate subunit TssK [Paraburkholderia caballeronis]PXW24939.1 type VI secretion system protein ImpJ [Paraburkholderia caballeronis]PXX00669.1 type VI secretion system protein ImpJ [Paraburkholderia caballeronis]RAJ98732.1 type VI secretion system protein ImpJ [Paraburkholderia caballeronis]TDV16451.1 type VI secretion system protein ImpJ [Paraburkholderia caballeronis]TDV18847.1 type VI secretion system protein ImpJ [Paraburkholderia caballeronis]